MWILTEENSFEIKGFNLSTKGELWVTKNDNGSIKVAGKGVAKEMYNELCEMVHASNPTMVIRNNKYVTNLEKA